MSQEQLDTRALEKAVRAETLIESHMNDCEARQAEIINRFDKSGAQVAELATIVSNMRSDQAKQLNKYLLSFVTMLLISLGYFLMRFGLPPGH